MGRLSLSFQPDEGEWQLMLDALPGKWSPEILTGLVRIELGRTTLERGVVLGVTLHELLENGMEILDANRGRRDVSLSGTELILSGTPVRGRVALELVAPGGRIITRRAKIAETEVDKREFADALVSAAVPLLDRLQDEQPGVLKTSNYWVAVSNLTASIRRWRSEVV